MIDGEGIADFIFFAVVLLFIACGVKYLFNL